MAQKKYYSSEELEYSAAIDEFHRAGVRPVSVLPEVWRMGLEAWTEADLRYLGAGNLMILSESPCVPDGCSPEMVKRYLDALARIKGTEDKPVFAPFRRWSPPAAYLQSEVDEDVLYLNPETGRFLHGERVDDPDLSDGVINIHAKPKEKYGYDPRVVLKCHQNDPYFLLGWEAEYLGKKENEAYRKLWLEVILNRMNEVGADQYREEIQNEAFGIAVLEAALIAYGAALEKGEKPYDEFRYSDK